MAAVEHRLRSVEDVADPPAEEARAQLEYLYRDHAQRVYAICVSVLRDRHEAEDAAQQVFVSAFRALLRGSEPRDGGAWLAAIARNECWSRARRELNVPLQPGLRDVTQEDPSTVVVRRSELARVWQAIEALPTSQRDALLLREVRGLGYDELVAELQLSHPSVRSLLNRARRTLRGRLEKGAAALTGAPWLSFFARVFGDASSPALSSASRTAAVGLGALAITGGGVVAPSLTALAHHRPAAPAVAHPTVAATRPVGEAQRHVAAVPLAPATPAGRSGELRGDRRPGGRRSRGSDDRRGSDGASGGRRAADGGSPGGGNSGSEPDGGSSASSGGGGPGSGGSSGIASGGHDGSGTDGGPAGVVRSGDGVVRTTAGSDGSGATSGGGGPGPSTGVGSGSDDSQTQVACSSGGGSSGSSGGSGSDGSSSSGGTTPASDGGGGSGSSSSSGPDDGSVGSGSPDSDS